MDSQGLVEKGRGAQVAGIFLFYFVVRMKNVQSIASTLSMLVALKLPCVSHVFLHCRKRLISYILVFMGHKLHDSLLGPNFLDDPRVKEWKLVA